jgi:hypothetical protein
MKKLIMIAIIAMIAMAGTASALDVEIVNSAGVAVTDPIIMQPGESRTFSAEHSDYNSVAGKEHAYDLTLYALSGDAQISHVTATLNKASVTLLADGSTFTDEDVFTLELAADAPATGRWQIVLTAGEAGTAGLQLGTASRDLMIPEFPTIALPVAAILGLAFFFQRRKEE